MLKIYWNLFIKGYGHVPLVLSACGLSIVISFIEGFNIGLLIPLLENLASTDGESAHWISNGMARVFETLNVPFNLNSILVALGALIFAGAGLKYLRLSIVNKLRVGAVVWLQSQYMWNMLNADYAHLQSGRLGVMTDTLTTQSARAGGTLIDIAEILTSSLMIAAYLLAAFLISPVLTAGAFAVLVAVSVGMHYFISLATKKGELLVKRDNEFQVAAVENLSGIQVVKSFLLERHRWNDFHDKASAVGQSNYELAQNQAVMGVAQEVALFAIIGGIVFMGVSVLDLGMPVIVALLFSLYRMTPRFSALNSFRQSLAGAMGSVRSVAEAIERPASTTIISGERRFNHLEECISLNSVHFSYNGGGPVLAGTGFTIEKGKMTAIVGASGAGKSTLIGLLQRFYDPVSGEIRVDGVDLKELDLSDWRRSVGIVSQDIFLFNDTIHNNIALGRPGLTREAVTYAARRAHAEVFIQGLPNGYDTVIGDRGWNLSGGQRQRIALARAILEEPQILILDEATSSLDSESERLIQDYIDGIRGSTTIVVVAHRTATIRNADKIVVLEEGRIVEEGDWTTLTQGKGIFANYQHLQAGG